MDVTICEAPSQRLAFSKGATARRSAVRISVGVFNVSQTGRRRLLLMGAAILQDEAQRGREIFYHARARFGRRRALEEI
jgi:hypothetical protein